MLRMKLQQAQIALATTDNAMLVTQEDVNDKEVSFNETKENLNKVLELHKQLVEDARSIEEKIKTISDVKSQFPIDDLRERHEAHQDLEKSLLQLKHIHETEKIKLKNQKKSIKILEEVPCGDNFPTCKFIKNSHVNKKNLTKQAAHVQEALEQVRAAKKSLAVLAKQNLNEKIEKYNQILERQRDLQVESSSKQLQITKVSNKKTVLSDLIKDLAQELNSMKLRVSNTEEAERISLAKKMILQINEKINAADAERLKHTEMIGHLDAKIDNTKVEKEKYSQLIEKWKTYELFMNAVSKKGIPLKIMSCQLPVINEEISKILQGVVGFTVELESEENSNDMDIYINYGDSKRIIECGSGMEKMMASLAIRVALINITSLPKSDMLIIDEGFGALDEMNVESCTRLLESLKRWFKNIVVISHVDAVKDAVDNVLDITQVEKNAKVVYE
jgi:DNA repair protein SbcC/Rad50